MVLRVVFFWDFLTCRSLDSQRIGDDFKGYISINENKGLEMILRVSYQ